MSKVLMQFIGLMIFSFSLSGQFESEVSYYLGSGTDTTYLVIDFKDGSFDSAYAWGYIYSGTKTGEDLLNAVAGVDINLEINIDTASFGNFLQDINYIEHEGYGGLPDFWSTWDGPDLASLTSNSGIASPLVAGGIFGVSYTDFNPAIAPGTPLPAYDPEALSFGMVNNWYGSGNDSLVMIIDFSDNTDTTSYAWGYLFSDSVSYLSVLNALDQADPALSVTSSGAVLSISYKNLSGMVGALADWYVWEAENWGNWRLRYADEVYLHPGDFGAVVYTRFLEPVRPVLPVNIDRSIGLFNYGHSKVDVFPNPASGSLSIDGSFDSYRLYSSSGEQVFTGNTSRINLPPLPSGVYFLEIKQPDGHRVVRKILLQ